MSFLTLAELEDLTGYTQGAAQARWLREKGYYVECNTRGIPRITWTQVHEKRRPAPELVSVNELSLRTEPNVISFREKLSSRQ